MSREFTESQQLIARIKRSSKYAYQAPAANGGWFKVNISAAGGGYNVRGNNNDYRIGDLAFGVRLPSGDVVEIGGRR